MRKRYLPFCFCFAALLFQLHLIGSSPGQRQKTQPNHNIQHEVSVTLKLVQIYVNDKRGLPVTDLARSDFEIWDNGQPKDITAFENHSADLPTARQQDEMMPVLYTKTPPILNRKFFLIFDFFRNDMAGISRAKKAALYFLEKQLLPDDEVAILSFSPTAGLTLHQNLTLDHQKAREAVQMTRGMTYFRTLDAQFDERLSLEDSGEDIDEAGGGQIMNLRGIIKDFFESMKALAKALRYTPGFKNIIFFSGGLSYALLYKKPTEIFPDELILGLISGSDENYGVTLTRNRNSSWVLGYYEDMIREFASANCPIYAIDTEGIRARFNRTDLRGEHSLKELSEQSGGKYLGDVNNYEVIADSIQKTTRNYYVLGYYINERWDGKFHEIKVRVKRKGLEIIAQQGYFNPRPFVEYSPFEKRLHLIDLVFSGNPQSQAPETLPSLALLAPRDKGANCLLLSEIQMDSMGTVAGKKAEIISLAISGAGAIVSARRGEVSLYSLPSRRIYHYACFSLNPGTYTFKTIIRNMETGRAAVGSSSLTIPVTLSSPLILYPLFLILPEREAYFLKSLKKNEGDKSLSPEKIYPVLPAKSRPVVDELEAGDSRILAGVRCSVPHVDDPDFKLSATLRDKKTDRTIPLIPKVITIQKEGQDIIFLVEIEFPELQSDEYELCLTVKEERSQSHDQVSRLLRIRKPN